MTSGRPVTPRTYLVPPEKVKAALASLPRPGALDEAIVVDVAEAYADGRLIEREAAPEGEESE